MITNNLFLFVQTKSLCPAVELRINYGFIHCKSDTEIAALKDVYRHMIAGGCSKTEMGEAMLRNDLFNLAKKYCAENPPRAWKKLKRWPHMFQNYMEVVE